MRMNKAHRKPVNLSLDADLVERARALDLKLSGIAEEAIRSAVKAEAARRWQNEHASAITAYNRLVDERGMLSDHIPGWWNAGDGPV
jgi:antitoxin CcdA